MLCVRIWINDVGGKCMRRQMWKLQKPAYLCSRNKQMKIIRYFCLIYTALVGLAIAVNIIISLSTPYGIRSGAGCNFYDALLVGIECRDFIGAKLIQLFFLYV